MLVLDLPRYRAVLFATLALAGCTKAPVTQGEAPVTRGEPQVTAIFDGTVRGDLGGRLDDRMKKLEADGFSGVLLVVKDGGVILAKGYGMADRDKKVPVTADTVMSIGSITKQFTGAAILKLETQGKLQVTDPITQYFKDVPDDKKGITLHHLLTHSAGLAAAIGDDYQPIGRDDYIRLALKSKLKSKPGERYRYSNVGYSLLGAIVEIATGQSYERYLHDQFFVPAGMMKTGYLLPRWASNELAHGYLPNGKDWGTMRDKPWGPDGPYWHLRANGGILSTAGDMYRWHISLLGETVLPKAAKDKYFTPHIPEGPPAQSHYGYGWVIERTLRGTTLITHNGGNGIFAADCYRYIDDNVFLFIASNVAGKSAIQASDDLLPLIFPPAEKPKVE
jgi:CubicO group peptidase (beta-lactamase class C family)